MVLQDLDGYITLGDPAARIAVARASGHARDDADTVAPAGPITDIRNLPGLRDLYSSNAPGAPGDPAPPPTSVAAVDASAIQAAVHELIAGTATLAEIAGRYGAPQATIAEWHRVYTDAGLRAVAALVGGPREP
jgi:hypothetical protein